MPGRNGTGPTGQGPLTGGGFGPCGSDRGLRGSSGRGFGGRAQGIRKGMGRGFGRMANDEKRQSQADK